MKVVLLCGGKGTRIRDVADDIPKPMIPVGDRPILWHIMKSYAHRGFQDFVLCTGYRGKVIRDFFLNYHAHTCDFTIQLNGASQVAYHGAHDESEWRVTVADTGAETMTGARVRRVQRYVDGADFFLTYGDGLGDIDLEALLRFHRAHGRILTVTGVRPAGRFGEIAHGAEGEVTEFNEKPQTTAGRISGGFFVCRPEIFNYLPEGDDLVFEHGPMKSLVADRQLMVYEHNGFWHPMDTYRDYVYLNQLYESGEAPWRRW